MGLFKFILLLCGAVIFLLWNEGRAVRRAQLLDEALYKCRPLSNIDQVNDSNDGHLVHLTGPLTTDKPLEDSQYGVMVSAVRLRRTVEMYQWVEYRQHTEQHDEDGKITHQETYHYRKEWRTDLVSSGSFAKSQVHQNPSSFPVKQMEWKAQKTTVGSFYLSPALVDLISNWKPIQLSLTREMKQQGMKIFDNQIYYSHKPWSPDIRDIRIGHEFAGMSDSANPNYVGIIACQSSGGELTTYYSADVGGKLLLLHFGIESCEEMLNKEHALNVAMTWFCRGLCIIFIGLLILNKLGGHLDDFPIIREIINSGLMIANVFLIAIGWLPHLTLITIALFSAAAIPYIYG